MDSSEETISNLILRVNDDLNHLQNNLKSRQNQDKIDVGEIKDLLSNAQNGFHKRAEELLNHFNNQVTSFTDIDAITTPGIKTASNQSAWQPSAQFLLDHINNHSNQSNAEFLPLDHTSPGQIMKRDIAIRSIANPHNRNNRYYAHDKFGIQLPLIEERKQIKLSSLNIQKGSVVQKLERLPMETNKNFNNSQPAKIQESDAQRGLRNLIERGLIPPNAKISFEPPAINNLTLNIHEAAAKYKNSALPAAINDQGFSGGIYMLDETNAHNEDFLNDEEAGESKKQTIVSAAGEDASYIPRQRRQTHDEKMLEKARVRFSNKEIEFKNSDPSKIKNLKLSNNIKEMSLVKQEQVEREETKPPATTPASLLSKANMDAVHKFSIKDSKTREAADDFIRFKKHYCLSWGGIVTVLKAMENLLAKYSVPLAFIDGDRLADVSIECELNDASRIDREHLISCIINRKDVLYYMNQPGRRFISGDKGRNVAATIIQSKWRSYIAHKEYLEYRRKQWAAGVIAIQWILHMKMSHVKVALQKTRENQLLNARRRFKNLVMRWPKLQESRRVIIHIPSWGLDEAHRMKIKHLPELQNYQMMRLCDLKDTNVDVIYVCPVPANDELLQYYSKLFGLKSAIDSGETANQTPLNHRYRIIVPEAIQSFPNHNMCLSTLLKYSPRALARIKQMIRGRAAWIVPGMTHQDDLDVADQLDVPILGTEPAILHENLGKSQIIKILRNSRVNIAPCSENVVSIEQLYEVLTQLIADNLSVKRWLFKTNRDIKSHGMAYLDVDQHLACYQWAKKEQKRYGAKWVKGWAQENAYLRIIGEIPDIVATHLVLPTKSKQYSSINKYLKEFFRYGGGVIQAFPASDSITNITVDVLIDPTGQIHILDSGDQIHDNNPLNAWGYSVPQSSIDAQILNSASKKIAEICKYKLLRGYISIDFVTFVLDDEENQYLWAIDIDLCYSDMYSLFNLAQFVTKVNFDWTEHQLAIDQSNKQTNEQSSLPSQSLPRYICLSSQLSNSNLSMVHYSVFFQMCRAHGIGFDVKEKQGTVFGLIDSFNRQNLSMITIGPSLELTLETFAKNLYVLQQEISSPNMPGQGNFKKVITEIENILGLVIENVISSNQNPANI